MTRPLQMLQHPTTADETSSPLPSLVAPPPSLIPLQAVWESLTLPQQQHLFHQLVRLCCGLLHPHPENCGEESPHDAP
jgi:hypothetical protein